METKKTFSTEIEKLKSLHGWQRLRYIWDYYKFPLAVLCILIYIIGYIIYGQVTHKDTVLCTALINISAGEEFTSDLSSGYLDYLGKDSSRNEVELMTELYLTDNESDPNYEYTYASQVKILASINSQQLDVILMNQEAFDILSRNDYLCDLEDLLSDIAPGLYSQTADCITENNKALDLSQALLIQQTGFSGTVYLGIVANSERKDEATEYIKYLFNSDTE
jgi:hypothetical protein